MTDRQILFTAPDQVVLDEFDFDSEALAADAVAIQTHYSLISPGTELACLRGTEAWARLPFVPGYAGVGEITAVGEEISTFRPGDMVFSYTKHASRVRANRLIAPIPNGLDERTAVFARMAAVGITALRVSNAELGDHVAVLGLGLVGNLCAQLFTIAGCEVIGIDLARRRVELARQCGVRHGLCAGQQDVRARVSEIAGGRMCEVVVDATGASAVIEGAAALAGKQGEVILLGSPRQDHTSNITPLLQSVHLWSDGCITFKGAHEWRYPVERDPNSHAKHSIERNVDIILRLIAEDRLHVRELLTHVLPPEECRTAYEGLRNRKEEFLGVLFDWTIA